MLSFGVLGQAIFLALGSYWCWQVFRRWRSDLDEFRSSTSSNTRIAIGALWAATAVIAMLWVGSVVGLVRGLAPS